LSADDQKTQPGERLTWPDLAYWTSALSVGASQIQSNIVYTCFRIDGLGL
jgi:hypothetical protein